MPTKLFVLDTNVLLHDPTALYRFDEHDVFIPMVVLEELDASKVGASEVARNARQASRTLDELLGAFGASEIDAGVPLPRTSERNAGRLFFQTREQPEALPAVLPGNKPDHSILAIALTLTHMFRDRDVVVVSKDINLRIKGQLLGLQVEDYRNDRSIDDLELLYTGMQQLPDDAWEHALEVLDTTQDGRATRYLVRGELVRTWYPNLCVYGHEAKPFEAVVAEVDGDQATLKLARDFRNERQALWGVSARNREQNFAMNLLADDDVDLVTLLGTAGTGKTLLALAAGLAQTMDYKRFREIVVTRVTIPVAEDIGFLPGTEEEKMAPWMGALMDNLEVLTESDDGSSDWNRQAGQDLLASRIKIRSPNFMRGRTFLNRYLIIDEAQNLTSKQLKTLLTRAGPGTKVVCIGNLDQIDTPYLTATTSGLTRVVDRFKQWSHSGHVTLVRGERSRLADVASETL
ncbi:MAG: PhoH family protein [Pseudomonadota bacterium]